jgi:hypothetical protein
MVEILCPHCDEEIGLDNDAIGEFSCPHCDEDFTWGGLSGDGTSTDIYNSKSFWIGFGIPNLFIILAWSSHYYSMNIIFVLIFWGFLIQVMLLVYSTSCHYYLGFDFDLWY